MEWLLGLVAVVVLVAVGYIVGRSGSHAIGYSRGYEDGYEFREFCTSMDKKLRGGL